MQIFRDKTFLAIILIPLCFLFAGAFKGASRYSPRLGPSMDGEVKHLLYHNQSGTPLPRGWSLSGYSFSDTIIRTDVKNREGRIVAFLLAYPLLEKNNRYIGATKSFNIYADKSGIQNERELQRLERAFFARIKANDQKYFFANPKMARREYQYSYVFRRYLFFPVLCYGLLVSALFTALNFKAIRSSLLPQNAVAAAALVSLIAVGALLRMSSSPEIPTHENGHGIREIRAVLRPDSPQEKETHYGDVYNSLTTAFLNAAGHDEQNIYLANEIFGSLSIIAIFMLAVATGLSAPAALFAAAALCASPMQIWISGSETPMASMAFFTLTGLSLLVVSIKNKNASLLWASAILLAVASSLHLISVFIAPVVIAFSVYAGVASAIREDKKFIQHAVLCSAVYIIWLVFHISCVSLDTIEKGKGVVSLPGYAAGFFGPSNLLWNAEATPLAIPVLALCGAIVAIKRKPSFAALFFAIIPIIALMGLTVNTCESANIRYQAPMQWMFYLAAAYFACSALPSQTANNIVGLICAVWLIAGALAGIKAFSNPDIETAEYRFIRNNTRKIPSETIIRLPAGNSACGGNLISEFPDFINNHRIVTDSRIADSAEIIYTGLDCYRYDKPEEMKNDMLPGGLRRECANVCAEGAKLVPIVATKLPESKTRSLWRISSKRPAIGFYRCEKHQ